MPRWSKDFDKNDPEFTAHNVRVATNWVGVINYVAMDSFIGLSMAMVTQIPAVAKVYSRERANKMYTAAMHYFSIWCTGIVIFSIYPIISATLSFHYLEI